MIGEPVIIRVINIVGGPLCVAADDGQHVYDEVATLLREGRPVVLSFAGIETVIAAFMSAAIGQLYGKFSEEHVCGLFSVRDLQADDRALLDRVVRNAKAYYANPAAFDAVWKEEFTDEDACAPSTHV